ncbi:phytoene desaturase family protein [Paenibacillus abyssi]|uniref:4,4'-diaponeurosporene oxygenase n=1 Tax=Paenibacillus abyssi TaxID=1340531 RepID=A0A917G371_9BACL|nr:phytoene desaturase family protein [Paenibacillus abyssi]GGG20727.1 diapolycopene oxygenase [Paenibacillus abyssi]
MRNGYTKKVIVIGAGLGGLSAAIRLAHAGFDVTVLEQQATTGGKLQRIEADGYRFDRGPSTITMISRFEQVFASVGRQLHDYVSLYPLVPRTRNIFADGSVVDLSDTPESMEDQIALYCPEDAIAYRSFRAEAARLYHISEQRFLNQLPLRWQDKWNPAMGIAFASIRPFTSLHQLLKRYFRHPNTLAMFGRYATYVGSSPYRAPAIFAMLAHVEAELGVYGVKGGTYSLAEAFVCLAEELGVRIQTGVRIQRIMIRQEKAVGVETEAGEQSADLVIANSDVLTVYSELIEDQVRRLVDAQTIAKFEPSLSGYVQLIGIRRQYKQLLHHTVFFPADYKKEFEAIFSKCLTPADPTIYICNPAMSDPEVAPAGGSSLFVLVNAPYISDAWNWAEQEQGYSELVLSKLETLGIEGLRQAEVRLSYTPRQLQSDTSAFRGAIYGISSNSARQTFFRPGNRDRHIDGLWFVGGTTHPGGGTPVVTQSGQLVAAQIIKLYKE